MVAAGGGAGHYTNSSNRGFGGHGGGIQGGNPYNLGPHNSGARLGRGATNTAGGCSYGDTNCGSFGLGGDATSYIESTHNGAGSGGGAGFYGGSSANIGAGGGGTSYIAYSELISYKEYTKSMYCYNCVTSNAESTYTVSTSNYSSTPTSYYAKSGNGHARITLLPQPSENNFLSSLTVKATEYETENPVVKEYTPTYDMATEDYYVKLVEQFKPKSVVYTSFSSPYLSLV